MRTNKYFTNNLVQANIDNENTNDIFQGQAKIHILRCYWEEILLYLKRETLRFQGENECLNATPILRI